MATQQLDEVIARQIAAVNARDTDAIVATFAPDAYLNDNGREYRGAAALREWVEREVIANKVTVEVLEATTHHGDVILRAAYKGDFESAGLPPQVELSNYYALRDGKIVSLVVCFPQPVG
jgi:hypothetical protein